MPNPTLILLIPALSLAAVAAMGVALLRVRRAWASEANRRQEAQTRALDFHRQTLRAVTGGRLRLCGPEDVPALLRGERLWSMPLLDPSDVSLFRQHLRAIAARRGFADGPLDDLCSSVSEAAANAVRHSQGGVAQVWAAAESFTVLVSDCGAGLAPDALLGAGAGRPGESVGLGFRLMLALADTVALCTGEEGTQLVLTVRNRGAADEAGRAADGDWQVTDQEWSEQRNEQSGAQREKEADEAVRLGRAA